MNDQQSRFEAWVQSLSNNEKLTLVRNLLIDIEQDLSAKDGQVEAPGTQAPPPSPVQTSEAKKAFTHPLGPPPDDHDPHGIMDLDELDPRIFEGLFGKPKAAPSNPEYPRPEHIDTLRLKDAADLFRRLLQKYGYIPMPPDFKKLASKARLEDKKRAFDERPRPQWHSWVSAADDAEVSPEEAEELAAIAQLLGQGPGTKEDS